MPSGAVLLRRPGHPIPRPQFAEGAAAAKGSAGGIIAADRDPATGPVRIGPHHSNRPTIGPIFLSARGWDVCGDVGGKSRRDGDAAPRPSERPANLRNCRIRLTTFGPLGTIGFRAERDEVVGFESCLAHQLPLHLVVRTLTVDKTLGFPGNRGVVSTVDGSQ